MDASSNPSPSNGADASPPTQSHEPSEIELFQRLKSYPFASDREFAKGLAIILQHPDVPASEDEINRTDDLVLQAKCFYFSRKEKLAKAIDFPAFNAWMKSNPESQMIENAGNFPTQAQSSTTNTPSTQEPAYPSSFAHIVELITTGQPIPGIQQIPDTVLEGQDTPSTKPRRRKPWEKDTVDETCST